MTDATYRVELAYAPDTGDDARPWRARIYDDFDLAPVNTVWGGTKESALLHAREWLKARAEHGEPETVLLNRNGDVIREAPKLPESAVPHIYRDGWGGHSVKVPK